MKFLVILNSICYFNSMYILCRVRKKAQILPFSKFWNWIGYLPIWFVKYSLCTYLFHFTFSARCPVSGQAELLQYKIHTLFWPFDVYLGFFGLFFGLKWSIRWINWNQIFLLITFWLCYTLWKRKLFFSFCFFVQSV